MTPNEKLINAAKIGDLPSFTDAVIQGADIDTSDLSGKSSLMYACENGHHVIARLCIERNASLFVTDLRGQTAMHYAESSRDRLTIELMNGATARATARLRVTPLRIPTPVPFGEIETLLTDPKQGAQR
jgi:ankyrin repeat protein